MNKRTIWVLAGVVLVAALAGGAIAMATGDSEGGATGPEADRAVRAALDATGGVANAVERDSEDGGTWEVEVTKPNGVTVDVRLDENYEVIKIEVDSEENEGRDDDPTEDENDSDE